jgi:MATE family multidrug resistance protein
MATTLLAYWAFGLPVGCLLAFPLGRGVFGLWVGLSFGLVAAAVVLLRAWVLKTRALGDQAGADR